MTTLGVPRLKKAKDRCKFLGAGSTSGRSFCLRDLVKLKRKKIVQLEGTKCNLDRAPLVPGRDQGPTCSDPVWQCRHSSLCSKAGRYQKQGGTRSRVLLTLAGEILIWAEENLASLSALHLKGSLNWMADFLSRKKISKSEWSLNFGSFSDGGKQVGQVHLFATHSNVKLPTHFSLNRRDRARGLDALAQPWDFHLCYAFPPIQLIPLVFKCQEESTNLILVAPYWPRRIWFSTRLNLAAKHHWMLPPRHDLLKQGPILYRNVSQLKLAVWFLRSRS